METQEEFNPLAGLLVFMIYGFVIGVIVGVLL
jgi:tetrahydromethanopterin S-methyltransferase subunit B